MTTPDDLASLPLDMLEVRCRQETQRYRQSRTSDTRFCLEIFRRALRRSAQVALGAPTYSDEDARTILVAIYSDFIRAQLSPQVTRVVGHDDLVQAVWLRFWQAAKNELAFDTLEQALSYLKQTAVTAQIEARRRQRTHLREQSLEGELRSLGEERFADERATMFDLHVRRRFRRRCTELLPDPLEQRIFWMRYNMDKPRAIAQQLAQEGRQLGGYQPTARRVSDLLERLYKRLADDPEIRDLLQSD